MESDIQKRQFFHMIVTAIMILIRDGIGYLFLLYLYLHTQMAIGEFAMYFSAISGIGMWLTKIADAFSAYQEVCGYVNDFYEFMELPEDERETEECQFEAPVKPSVLVNFRKRLTAEYFMEANEYILGVAGATNEHKPENESENAKAFSLLNEAKEKLEAMIDYFHKCFRPWDKPRTYRRVARKGKIFYTCLMSRH